MLWGLVVDEEEEHFDPYAFAVEVAVVPSIAKYGPHTHSSMLQKRFACMQDC